MREPEPSVDYLAELMKRAKPKKTREEEAFDRGFTVGAIVGGFVSFVVTLVLVALIHG